LGLTLGAAGSEHNSSPSLANVEISRIVGRGAASK
jgi:hypothetical protein